MKVYGDDLDKLGLELDVLKVQNVSDEQKYLANLGRGRIATMLRDAAGRPLPYLDGIEFSFFPDPNARTLALRTRRIIQENFAWSIGYNLLVLPLAASGWLPPYLAAAGMSLSSLIVVTNSMRLNR